MSCSWSLLATGSSPSFFPAQSRLKFLPINSKTTKSSTCKPKASNHISAGKLINNLSIEKTSLAVQLGAILASVEQPALAVTGNNDTEDFTWTLISAGIVAFWYFLIMPPVIFNWLRLRWYKRKLLEMYLQFMFVFLFFPGVILWAPFINFRRFPRDPTMKYPWSTPQDPSLNEPKSL
ncbi:inorganic carbon transport protein-like protein isoform X2 [Tasmannia lanceolata]|uniref:inorganic carbon transport protein-like protein isoform X2 n=1 Tax=Tasmannia lanceolata TaxID=3420 RepID=UPI0040636282